MMRFVHSQKKPLVFNIINTTFPLAVTKEQLIITLAHPVFRNFVTAAIGVPQAHCIQSSFSILEELIVFDCLSVSILLILQASVIKTYLLQLANRSTSCCETNIQPNAQNLSQEESLKHSGLSSWKKIMKGSRMGFLEPKYMALPNPIWHVATGGRLISQTELCICQISGS